MTTDSDLLRQAVAARDRALRQGLPDTARALSGIVAMIAAVEAQAGAGPAADRAAAADPRRGRPLA